VWVFGDDINTDLIIPGRYLDNYDPAHLAAHAMEGVDSKFANTVRKGDIIIAGKSFGSGSSREQAVIALKSAGVAAVVAKSFARIFYRNAINAGLPAILSEDASDIFSEEDVVVLDSARNRLESEDGAKRCSTEGLPSHVEKILDAGGLVPLLKSKVRAGGAKKNV
jgi:3-isopropylmalate/(R)-2-methylmalate dehydratase small subunit